MHELGIANQVLDVILSEAKKRNAKVNGIKLKIGRMSGLEPESLAFLLQTIAKNTPAEGLEVTYDLVDPIMECKNCGNIFTVQEMTFWCPKCGGGDCEMKEGKDLVIETISMEVPDEGKYEQEG